jgi:hypothetical protein
MKTYSPLCLGGVLLIGPGVFVQAGVSDWQAAAASQSNLMHLELLPTLSSMVEQLRSSHSAWTKNWKQVT